MGNVTCPFSSALFIPSTQIQITTPTKDSESPAANQPTLSSPQIPTPTPGLYTINLAPRMRPVRRTSSVLVIEIKGFRSGASTGAVGRRSSEPNVCDGRITNMIRITSGGRRWTSRGRVSFRRGSWPGALVVSTCGEG